MQHYHETGEHVDHDEVIELLRRRAKGESPA
jgi:predicted transcriptional regulator